MRVLGLLVALSVAACGPLKDPFGALKTSPACTQDAECSIAFCPNACNFGQPFCSYPQVFLKQDIEKACPCVSTPTAPQCAAPPTESCGPQPGCAVQADFATVRAACVGGVCIGQFPDGGVASR